jgi:hypothetical protein
VHDSDSVAEAQPSAEALRRTCNVCMRKPSFECLKGVVARRAGYTSGCAEMTDNPGRLFFYMIPACHIGVLEPFVRSIMHVKSYQLGALCFELASSR